ncbi:MAG: hypothetical protein EOP11_15140 [Proteobacteria bacterium]|nr:MAG: hypothetical protein EOP11_15140 [Pseudomonadota bacterium]
MRAISFLVIAISLACQTIAHAKPETWLSPNLQSEDYRALMDNHWNKGGEVQVFKFHSGNLADSPAMAPNILSEFKARNGFARLKSFGLKIAIETGVIKPAAAGDSNPGWCNGAVWKQEGPKYVRAIEDNGGTVSYLTMDEPLFQTVDQCKTSYETVLDGTLAFASAIKAEASHVKIIDIEPYPGLSLEKMKKFVLDLKARGRRLDGFHLDINREGVDRGLGINVADPAQQAKLQDFAKFLHDQNIRFGIIFWSQHTASDEAYVTDVKNFYAQAGALRDVVDDFIFQSWHPSADGRLNIPKNLGSPNSHFGLIQTLRNAPIPAPDSTGGACSKKVSQAEYLETYPDVKAVNANPFLHWQLFGKAEGRCQPTGPCTMPLSKIDYLSAYPDVKANGADPGEHYRNYGQAEGRCPIE